MKQVYIFDVDDTLIDTKACVRVIDEQGHIKYRLGTKVHNSCSNISEVLYPKMKLDYSEFRSLSQLHSEPKRWAFNTLRHYAWEHQTDVYIITAREDSSLIWNWLMECGVQIPITNIFTNEFTNQTLGDWKKDKLLQIAQRYNEPITAHIWEDDENCLTQMKAQESDNLSVVLEDIF